ncbi:WAT1-related protein At5g64700 isoform X2 [Coffea arabica]|uniref:WAT1-related protein n=1 Tax=Coffea arabica TaxID=13443 RepID=A0A6P6TJG3_COFAR
MEGYKLYLAAVSVQVFHSIMHIVSKAAIDDGFKTYILVFYRQAIATVFLAPITIFLEWKSAPPLTLMTFVKMCILSLLGFTLTWNLNNMALRYTSAPLAAAINNTIPVITFFLAVLFRMENFNLKTIPGISKFAGIALCLGGSATIAFYHGAPYLKLLVHHHLLKIHSLENPGHAPSSTTWVKGVLLMFLAYILWSSWLVLQGIMVNGVGFNLIAWVLRKKGPLFQAIWVPLVLLFTTCFSAVFLGEIISLGSVVGAVLLVMGLHCVLWGKIKEQSKETENCSSTVHLAQISQTAPKDEIQVGSTPKHSLAQNACSYV